MGLFSIKKKVGTCDQCVHYKVMQHKSHRRPFTWGRCAEISRQSWGNMRVRTHNNKPLIVDEKFGCRHFKEAEENENKVQRN
jgi:endogenous inhibitor of DNA gyrase (YacG/DUF329 family)